MNNNDFMKNVNKNFSDFAKNLKSLLPELNQFSKSVVNLGEIAADTSPYQKEIDKIKEMTVQTEKYKELKNSLSENLNSNENNVKNLTAAYEETLPLLEQLGLDTTEFQNIFTSAFDKITQKSETFSDTMKNMLDDLKNYFIKTIAKAISDKIVSSSASEMFSTSLASQNSDTSGSFNIFGLIKSFLGVFSSSTLYTRHSGGVVPSGTGGGYALPGTSEYLAVLKGGERVLSPAENSDFNSGQNGQNVVVNNFNVKAWDSKDVQKYLLDNKNLIANITADNIKYNNANLRYMIGGS